MKSDEQEDFIRSEGPNECEGGQIEPLPTLIPILIREQIHKISLDAYHDSGQGEVVALKTVIGGAIRRYGE